MVKRDKHYDIEQKTDIITKHLNPQFDRPYARRIAEATDCFTFLMLDELIKALKIIAKGNPT